MDSHTCTYRCGSKCDKCGICRKRIYVGDCVSSWGVILDDCEYCSPIKANCYVCGTSLRTYKTRNDNTIRVAPCPECSRKTSTVSEQISTLPDRTTYRGGTGIQFRMATQRDELPSNSSLVNEIWL